MKGNDIPALLDESACEHSHKQKTGCSAPKPGATAGACAFDGAQITLLPLSDVAHLVHGHGHGHGAGRVWIRSFYRGRWRNLWCGDAALAGRRAVHRSTNCVGRSLGAYGEHSALFRAYIRQFWRRAILFTAQDFYQKENK